MTFILIMNFIIPLVILIGGLSMKKIAKGKINSLAGYRTTMSMKNKDTWEFAHLECSSLWVKYGAILIAITILITIISLITGIVAATIICLVYMFVSIAVIFVSIFQVESRLKETFDQNGNRR